MKFKYKNWNFCRKILLLVFFTIISAQSAFTMDDKSVAMKFGATGYEGKFTSGNSTYTLTTYNPDIQLKFDLPAIDIKERCFLSLGFSYDFSWARYSSSDLNVYLDDSLFSHTFSLFPELVFSRNDLRFIVGTGLGVGIYSYDYEYKTTSSKETSSRKEYQFFWNLEAGVKYYLTEKFSLLTDFTISVPFFAMRRNHEYSNGGTRSTYADISSNGAASMYYSPKVGACWSF